VTSTGGVAGSIGGLPHAASARSAKRARALMSELEP
jgi:hypothetical protein